ncbi:MAG: hypothetical protein DI628_08555 [Blastochloris viridis]|uniref:Toxin co-regulated pilus biosynthesis protein Q C-terminal domain-containing protein n=1 Tax=Blastochloris viridis TaxID=1079 RepID=A0A6N4RD33_BLAVI|nr:MAG: hypothetical protein DI628_08555 [Blastochloris viridis]
MKLFQTLPQQTRINLSGMRHAFWAVALASTVLSTASAAPSLPVPGYVAPVVGTDVAPYVDDTRGVYIPPHQQLRQKTDSELANWDAVMETNRPLYAQQNPAGRQYERALNTVASGVADTRSELDRIAGDPGLLQGGKPKADADLYAQDEYADNTETLSMNGRQLAQNTRASQPRGLEDYPSLATGGRPRTQAGVDIGAAPSAAAAPSAPSSSAMSDGGVELAVGGPAGRSDLDLQNGIVRLKEERISVRRAMQRMLDQVGGAGWTVVWDLDEVNAGLPDMEISIYAEEPFIKVMNAMLARLQTRSGQPIRVIKYDKTQRLVVTDRTGGDARSGSIGAGGAAGGNVAITETVLKESTISLHYDEIPLVDALENIVNQAGKGQWRLRMYAGTDQVLKPAHVEEPFGVALERILKVFNLRYEIFPGGKLIVVTSGSTFGFRGVE